MRVITVYQCECCGREYKNKDQAMECESAHVTITRISKSYYGVDCPFAGKGYPAAVLVDFSDGTNLWYERPADEVTASEKYGR